MKLQKIKIENFKSIISLELDVSKPLQESFCYGFLGINESGKSNILQAINFKDSYGNLDLQQVGCKFGVGPTTITYIYELSAEMQIKFHEMIATDTSITNLNELQKITLTGFEFKVSKDANNTIRHCNRIIS